MTSQEIDTANALLCITSHLSLMAQCVDLRAQAYREELVKPAEDFEDQTIKGWPEKGDIFTVDHALWMRQHAMCLAGSIENMSNVIEWARELIEDESWKGLEGEAEELIVNDVAGGSNESPRRST